MRHEDFKKCIIMVRPDNRKKGKLNLSALQDVEINENDLVLSHEINSVPYYYKINEILNRRQSSMDGRDYIETKATLVNK